MVVVGNRTELKPGQKSSQSSGVSGCPVFPFVILTSLLFVRCWLQCRCDDGVAHAGGHVPGAQSHHGGHHYVLSGMPPEQVENDIMARQERFFTLAPGIEHMESRVAAGRSRH